MKEWKEINEADNHLYPAAYVILALKSVSVNFNVFLDKDSGEFYSSADCSEILSITLN